MKASGAKRLKVLEELGAVAADGLLAELRRRAGR
jgi:hypothetical protein